MPTVADPARVPPLTLVLRTGAAAHEALQARLARLRAALGDGHDVVLVGTGPAAAASLRRVAAADPRHRVLLHAHRCGAVEALVAGVAHARSPWVVALADRESTREGDTVAELLRAARQAAAPACVHAGSGQPVLFARDGFLALAPIAQMRAYLPELFARSGADVRTIVAAGTTAAAGGLGRWLRRTRVALLCRMTASGSVARA